MSNLHMYTNGDDWVVASSLEEARAEYDSDDGDEPMRQLPDDEPFTCPVRDDGERAERGEETTQTKTLTWQQWANENGPGLWASVDA